MTDEISDEYGVELETPVIFVNQTFGITSPDESRVVSSDLISLDEIT